MFLPKNRSLYFQLVNFWVSLRIHKGYFYVRRLTLLVLYNSSCLNLSLNSNLDWMEYQL